MQSPTVDRALTEVHHSEETDMSKREIRFWWVAGFVAELLAFALSLLIPRAEMPGRLLHGHPRVVVSLLISCALAATIGVAIQVAAWLKAMSNTRRLADAVWYQRLRRWGIIGALLTPLLGLGAFICWAVMLDYLRNGPEAVQITFEGPPAAHRPAAAVGERRR
jgi:uncharacterized membrane protein